MERALCSANLAYAQTAFPLTGAARNSFIQSALKTCAPGLQNFGLSADKVEQICSCYANAMADNFNAGGDGLGYWPGAGQFSRKSKVSDSSMRQQSPLVMPVTREDVLFLD